MKDQTPLLPTPESIADTIPPDAIFPQGGITEIIGGRSSGKTGFILSALGSARERSGFSAIIDPTDSFDPATARKAGIELTSILWIRCPGNLDAALKSTDYLLHAGGFSCVILDLADVRPDIVSRIPYAYWFRFRLAVENRPTIFLLVSPVPCSGSSSSASLECLQKNIEWTGSASHRLLKGITATVLSRKRRASPGMLRSGMKRERSGECFPARAPKPLQSNEVTMQ